MSKKKIILYPHGGSKNHGCEALVRVLSKFIDNDVTLYSSDKIQDEKYGIEKICTIKDYQNKINRFSYDHLVLFLRKYLFKDLNCYELMPYYKMIKDINKNDIAISFGGDNYCYEGMTYQLKIIDRELDRKKVKRILWGCSIEDSSDVTEDLKGFSLIAARESLTFEKIKNINDNVILCPDPAFLLPKEKVEKYDFSKKYVGINISPMIIENETDFGITYKNYINVIHYILTSTDMNVLLIPHVVWESNNDLTVLKKIKTHFNDDRVILCEDYNCKQLKYIISKCKFMITARTHASIAAYSTKVPTLVVGYSIKAKGIATDLFGSWENYVIPVQNLISENQLTESFKWLIDSEKDILNKYDKIMPNYIEECKNGLIHLNNFIREI